MNNTIIEWGCLSIKPSTKRRKHFFYFNYRKIVEVKFQEKNPWRRKLKSTFTTTNEQKEKGFIQKFIG